jgi:hypothetical protein
MQELIDRKIKEMRELGVVNREFRIWLEQSDLWYWLYSSLRIMGEAVEKRVIVDILDGKIVEDAPIDAYNFITGYSAVYKDMRSCAEMDSSADVKLLRRWGGMLLGYTPEFRADDPVVYEWNHIPPFYKNIAAETDGLLRRAVQERRVTPALKWAAMLHLEFCRLYPFGKDTPVMAGLLLAYCLIREGYPLPSLTVGDIEYNKMIDAYVNKGEYEAFEGMLERSVLNRAEAVLQLNRRAAEVNEN